MIRLAAAKSFYGPGPSRPTSLRRVGAPSKTKRRPSTVINGLGNAGSSPCKAVDIVLALLLVFSELWVQGIWAVCAASSLKSTAPKTVLNIAPRYWPSVSRRLQASGTRKTKGRRLRPGRF
jgi:hypothetical protein